MVDVAVHDRRIFFRVGRAILSSRLIDGAFPPYEQVIPQASAKAVDLKPATSPPRSAARRC